MNRPALVPIHLRELRLAEEFTTSATQQVGHVIDWGYLILDGVHVRAVACAFGSVMRYLNPDLVVLVPFDRPHCRAWRDEERWTTPLERSPKGHSDLLMARGAIAGRRFRADRAEA